MLLIRIGVPSGSEHVDGGTPDRVDEEAVRVSGGDLLALVDGAPDHALLQSVKGSGVHLKKRDASIPAAAAAPAAPAAPAAVATQSVQ